VDDSRHSTARRWTITDRTREYRSLSGHMDICCLAGLSPGDGGCGRCGRYSDQLY
jgi:hypothetical protein